MSIARHHNEWLSLVPVSGPFLSMPVLMRVFPQGLGGHESEHFRTLRLAYEEWSVRKNDPAIHKAWIKFVLGNTLELPDEVIDEGQAVMLQATISPPGETIRPDYVIKNPAGVENAGKPRLLICTYPPSQNLERPVAGRHWKASPDTRMMELLHRTHCRIGLVTNGEHWMLVDAPSGETTGYISWYANLWLDEKLTLRAFRSLLGVRRFFSVPDEDILETMLAESAANQQEVTDQLGYQVRNAVEVLVQSLDRADRDRGGKLLKDISEEELYEAALTVMMRLVFLFSAEERELLPLDDPLYNQNYAVSTLRAALRETADQQTEDVLERRRDAWCRLLSTFRSVYGGIQHDRLTLPPYGGHLLDPDRFPFLEGREDGTKWRDTRATPLPVNNRTVLHLLEALQILQVKVPGGGHAEARLLSFRALGIEQIGHVYEGLLDHTAKRAPETVLGFAGGKDKEPEIPLSKLEELREKGEKELIAFLKKETGRTASPLKKALAEPCDIEHANRCKVACGNDRLWKRVHPFAALVRSDTFGRPVIIREGSVFVTAGTDRRTSGTHYTPRILTEEIVQHTLEPLVYQGPAEGKPENEWKLKSPAELLDLKICDMACGSGAFLVQVCRYLSELLVEAWENVEKGHPGVVRITPEGQPSEGEVGEQLIPVDPLERLIFAQRLVAGRCLYGVDKNPLAAEMAKLSLWLLTLAKDTPFEFLDHAIRCGDSLVGIDALDQLRYFELSGNGKQNSLIVGFLKDRIQEAVDLRRHILSTPAQAVNEVAEQERLLEQAEAQVEQLRIAADVLVGAEFAPFEVLGISQEDVLDDDDRRPVWLKAQKSEKSLRELARKQAALEVERHFLDSDGALNDVASSWLNGQPTFHWSLEFPEVFLGRKGFDAFVGNPPFMGGSVAKKSLGDTYKKAIARILGRCHGNSDIAAWFFRRAGRLSDALGGFGLLGSDSIAEGDTRETGLFCLVDDGFSIYWAKSGFKWPGSAQVRASVTVARNGSFNGRKCLDSEQVRTISSRLDDIPVESPPPVLVRHGPQFIMGTKVYGEGFVLSDEERDQIVDDDPNSEQVIQPYQTGHDLNNTHDQTGTRCVINFDDLPEDEASQFTSAYVRVYDLVRPERMSKTSGKARREWWKYERRRPELYRLIKNQQYILAKAATSSTFAFAWVKTGAVYANTLFLAPLAQVHDFAVVSSSIYESWATLFCSTLKGDMRFAPTDMYENFPFPESVHLLEEIARKYDDLRRSIMSERREGLTATYNRFHDQDVTDRDIQALRQCHVDMDMAVVESYAWSGLELGHDFYARKQGICFGLSDTARRHTLERLLKLNQNRYQEEVSMGLRQRTIQRRTRPQTDDPNEEAQNTLFSE